MHMLGHDDKLCQRISVKVGSIQWHMPMLPRSRRLVAARHTGQGDRLLEGK